MLTEHQKLKKEEALSHIYDTGRVLIKGSAGVGKTYLVGDLIEDILRRQPKAVIQCTAPTNKAVAVLKDKMDISKVELITTHKALKIARTVDSKTGEVSFRPSFNPKYPPLKGVNYLIVDESSMISLEMLLDMEEHAEMQNCTIIFLGDDKQLEPVGEDDSPVFLGKPEILPGEPEEREEGCSYIPWKKDTVVKLTPYPTVEITEIVRQKNGNPIIDLSRNLENINSMLAKTTEIGGYIYTEDKERILNSLAAINGSDELKYLAFTNDDVDKVNRAVRRRIYGENPKKVELGESLIFDEPYGTRYYTNEEIKVERLQVVESEFMYPVNDFTEDIKLRSKKVKLKYYLINSSLIPTPVFKEEDSWSFDDFTTEESEGIKVIHEDSEEMLQKVLREMRNCAKVQDIAWSKMYAFKENFASIKYNHALTIHKSQGSTFRQVIMNVGNTNLNPDVRKRKRLLYTGVTRASDLLILFNV